MDGTYGYIYIYMCVSTTPKYITAYHYSSLKKKEENET